jgi:hypothetical protein
MTEFQKWNSSLRKKIQVETLPPRSITQEQDRTDWRWWMDD